MRCSAAAAATVTAATASQKYQLSVIFRCGRTGCASHPSRINPAPTKDEHAMTMPLDRAAKNDEGQHTAWHEVADVIGERKGGVVKAEM